MKRSYEKAFRDSERAQDAFKKADSDYNLSRAEVDRVNNLLIKVTLICSLPENCIKTIKIFDNTEVKDLRFKKN